MNRHNAGAIMQMNKQIFLSTWLCCLLSTSFSQNVEEVKSQYLEIWRNHDLHDTLRLQALSDLSWELRQLDPTHSVSYAELEYQEAEKINDYKFMADALSNQASAYHILGEHDLSIELYKQAIALEYKRKNMGDPSPYYSNLGQVYSDVGEYKLAIEALNTSLKLNRLQKDSLGESIALATIGIVYMDLDNRKLATSYFNKSLEMAIQLKDTLGISACYNNLGIILGRDGKLDSALYYYSEACTMDSLFGDDYGYSINVNNIAGIYLELGRFEEAKILIEDLLIFFEEIGDEAGVSSCLNGLSKYYIQKGDINAAIIHAERGLETAQKINLVIEIRAHAETLSDCYGVLGNYKKAYEMSELYHAMNDSIENLEIQQEVLASQMQFEFKQKRITDSLMVAEQARIKNAELSATNSKLDQEKFRRYVMIAGLLLIAGVSLFIYQRLKLTARQKKIIEHQKREVEDQRNLAQHQKMLIEEKNKEITDSISYARRIQAAILPPERIFKTHFPESFIFYQPKDIVAGDFYWLEISPDHANTTDEIVFFAVADCTGHGVPGAMVSVICNNGLNRAVREHGLTDPGEILDKTRQIVISEFEKSDEEMKDGMDISLCALNKKNKLLKWTGANNPLWLISKINSEIRFTEIKANKQPIGKFISGKPFTTHEIQLESGDCIYIFSDGYPDQFGGDKGKKFKEANLKNLLTSIADKPMTEQVHVLKKQFEMWKGNLEQVDDVCIVGIQV